MKLSLIPAALVAATLVGCNDSTVENKPRTALIMSIGAVGYQPELEPAIATFINIPWQGYVAGSTMPVGVAAYHLEGIARVDFYAEVGAPAWDLDGDGTVGAGDLAILLNGMPDTYDGYDLSDLLGEWGMTTGSQLLGSASVETNGSTGLEDIGYWIDVEIDGRFSLGLNEITAVAVPNVGLSTTLSGPVDRFEA